MNLNELKKNWDQFGKEEPYWAILINPSTKGNKWDEDAFFETGRNTVGRFLKRIQKFVPDFPYSNALDFGCIVSRLS